MARTREKQPVGHPTIFPGEKVKVSARITKEAQRAIAKHAEDIGVTFSQALESLIRLADESLSKDER